MKITLTGRPGAIERRRNLVITTMEDEIGEHVNFPAGIPRPSPEPMAYTVYISSKQWERIATALENPEDEMIVDGLCTFDEETGFMRARKSNGQWKEPFDPFHARFGGDYTEGNAWQYTWYVPHDVQGLIELMGGNETFIQKLDDLFVKETDAKKYDSVDDISGLIGQYVHGNEPSHHIAYLYNYAGAPHRTQERIKHILDTGKPLRN